MDMEPDAGYDLTVMETIAIIVVMIIAIIVSLPELIIDVFRGIFAPTLEDWRTK